MSENTDILVKKLQDDGKGAPWWVWFVIDLIVVVMKCALSAFVAGAIVFIASTQSVSWSSMDEFAKKLIILAALVAAAKDVLSFLSTAMTDIKNRLKQNP